MNKHTKGPWFNCGYGEYADYNGKCIIVLGDDNTRRVTVVLGRNTPETQANARLIAAAPELLEALENLHANIAEYAQINNLGGFDNQDMQQARAAIAKAKGEA